MWGFGRYLVGVRSVAMLAPRGELEVVRGEGFQVLQEVRSGGLEADPFL